MAKIKTRWTKTSPWGNYNDTPDRKNSRTNAQTMILREAKSLGIVGRHAGSKPLSRILDGLAKAHEAQKSNKKETDGDQTKID